MKTIVPRNTLHSKHQAGFTLPELMMVGSLSLLLMLALFQIVSDAQHMSEIINGRITLNQTAREIFDMLMDGGVRAEGADAVEADRIEGYHGRHDDPFAIAAPQLTRPAFRLRFARAVPAADADSLFSRSYPALAIGCTAAQSPLSSCIGVANLNVDGYIDNFASNGIRTVNGNRELTFTVINPPHVPRANGAGRFTAQEYSDTFWTVFTLNVD
ncbi:MAG: prepilin-type N-terminal cleavage/methylation domain-containing protein [Magnetococcus sp. DMHC-1]